MRIDKVSTVLIMKILITGFAGFIGFHAAREFLRRGWGVVGIYVGIILGCFVGGTVGYIWAKVFIRRFKEISIKKYEKHEENSS